MVAIHTFILGCALGLPAPQSPAPSRPATDPPAAVAPGEFVADATDGTLRGTARISSRSGRSAVHFAKPTDDPAQTAGQLHLAFAAQTGTYHLWLRGSGNGSLVVQVDEELDGTATQQRCTFDTEATDAARATWIGRTRNEPLAVQLDGRRVHHLRWTQLDGTCDVEQIWLSQDQADPPAVDAAPPCTPRVPLAEEGFSPLFDGQTLQGWHAAGGAATYRVASGCIVGEVGPGANSFLCTDQVLADFELRLSLRLDIPVNSGIQLRSHVDDHGRVYGYQCEVDPTARGWSGGIFDEGRRGWLFSLDRPDQAIARSAFRRDAWNDYVIRAEGDVIRTWVNGIPCATLTDTLDRDGFVALQVHAAERGRILFRDVRVREIPHDPH